MVTSFKPVIFGCSGLSLSSAERVFFAAERPCGLIVFRRNCASIDQLSALVAAFREAVADPMAPVFVDQEGGRVLRLKRPYWRQAPSHGVIGKLADADPDGPERLARDVGAAIGAQLAQVGVNVNLAPCLDVRFPYTHDSIDDRAFHSDPKIVTRLGASYIDGLKSVGVQAALKHLPGHGRARLDSHRDLPTIDVDSDDLAVDFAPFKALAQAAPWAIVSHLLFPALDPHEPATTSRRIIGKIVRNAIGFEACSLQTILP
jgi:beta-N-acetylhexosaminidase